MDIEKLNQGPIVYTKVFIYTTDLLTQELNTLVKELEHVNQETTSAIDVLQIKHLIGLIRQELSFR